MPDALLAQTVTEQAETVRSGVASAHELVEASLAAIDRLNGELNAFVTLAGERALAEADAIPPGDARPLAGVPIAIKDVGQLTEGIRTTMGTAAMGDWVPPFDSALVRRVRRAGAIIVGKTNTPELGILPVTEPDRFGPTRNPWDPERTPGGSSGGSAAAVAAGMVALGHGTDGGGSIRIPASCCGLVGLKPSRGRISLAPGGESAGGITTDGVLTRTVADTALALDVVSGYEWGDPYWAPPPAAPFSEAVGRSPGRLRVGLVTSSPTGADVDGECVAAARDTADLLESLGHAVEETTLDVGGDNFARSFEQVFAAGVDAGVRQFALLLGEPPDPERLEPLTLAMRQRARSLSSSGYLVALNHLRLVARGIVGLWAAYDVLLTPTLTKPPLPIGALRADEGQPVTQMLDKAAAFIPFTPPFNVTGQPAVSLPLGASGTGIPIGVQLVGAPAGEELLLSLAAQLEQARPWAERWPELAES